VAAIHPGLVITSTGVFQTASGAVAIYAALKGPPELFTWGTAAGLFDSLQGYFRVVPGLIQTAQELSEYEAATTGPNSWLD
jgi:hypothetical protein